MYDKVPFFNFRDLLMLHCSFLRSILDSIPISNHVTLSLPSVGSQALKWFVDLLEKGSIDCENLKREDIEDVADIGNLLGINIANLLPEFDRIKTTIPIVESNNSDKSETVGVGHAKKIDGFTTAVQTESQNCQKMVEIKVEPLEECELSSVVDIDFEGIEGNIEDGEIMTDLELEESINIKTNEKELEDLLSATKSEIEKILVRKTNEKSSHNVDNCSQEIGEYIQELREETVLNLDLVTTSSRKNVEGEVNDTSPGKSKILQNSIKCLFCPFSTNNEKKLPSHQCEKVFSCSQCEYSATKPISVMQHAKSKHKTLHTFMCSKCKFLTSDFGKMVDHSCQTSNGGNLCMRCGRSHAAPCKHSENTVCDECGKIGHVTTLHHPLNMKAYKLIKEIDSTISLEIPTGVGSKGKGIPKNNSSKIWQCKECPYRTSKASMMKYHARQNHACQYMFTCNICMFATTDNKMFPIHRCKKEVNKCTDCDFTTSNYAVLQRHISSQHQYIEKQTYVCGSCQYTCRSSDSFRKHQLANCQLNYNADALFFACDQCGHAAPNIQELRRHKTEMHVNQANQVRPEIMSNKNSGLVRSVSPYISDNSRSGNWKSDQMRNISPGVRERSRSRQRFHSGLSRSSSTGPSSPFPQVNSRAENRNPHHSRYQNIDGHSQSIRQSSKNESGKQKANLCLRCGRWHQAPCRFHEDTICPQSGCGRRGHVASLHFPKSFKDYSIIRNQVPDIIVIEPSTSKRVGPKKSNKNL